ncbi:MAG: hypothetical protein RJB26_1207 [Pseudomonadota bacterium]
MKRPAFILGGTGYVAGELLRLLVAHPHLEVAGILSDSQPGERVAKAFPHLAAAFPELTFIDEATLTQRLCAAGDSALFGAAPHGVSATLIDRLLTAANAAGANPRVVDISADYRFSDVEAYAKVYKHAHAAPVRQAEFTCAAPEHVAELHTPHVAHPGCFATATLLATVPLVQLGVAEPQVFVSGVTGSTGAGRSPTAGTHHPQRHSDLYSYNALGHRHAPEVEGIVANLTGVRPHLAFVPHSGPFARGIHLTAQAKLAKPMKTADVLAALRAFYAGQPFVRVLDEAPRVKDVVTSNYAHVSAAADGQSVAVMVAIDNLTKGAAGGAVQWMNRLCGYEQTAGLLTTAPGWT